jgi:hypothetical protein
MTLWLTGPRREEVGSKGEICEEPISGVSSGRCWEGEVHDNNGFERNNYDEDSQEQGEEGEARL